MKTAIIIGVGPDRGLGGQLCRRFASEGHHVIVAGRTQTSLDAIVTLIQADGGSAEAVVADATSESDITRLFDAAGEQLDLAIYNAGNNTRDALPTWMPSTSSKAGGCAVSADFCSAGRRYAA